jgi:hypothetical protein
MTFKYCTFEIYQNFCYAFQLIRSLQSLGIYPMVGFSHSLIIFKIPVKELDDIQKRLLNNFIQWEDLDNVRFN